MNKKEWNSIVKEISKYHSRLYHACNNKGWRNYVGVLDDIERADEKEHRKWKPDHVSSPLGLSDSYKLFTVQHVFEGFNSNIRVEDILHIRTACFYGVGIAKEFHKEITEEFSPEEIEWFLKNVDYAKLMEGWN